MQDETTATPGPEPALTLVTVVFEAEVPLLALQARSLARYVGQDDFSRIIVIDNTHAGLGRRTRRRLLEEYGAQAPKVVFLRPDDICRLPPGRGWVLQQVLKLMVFAHVDTPYFLVLDAKNHWIDPTSTATFLAPDGRTRGATHEYRQHPLRPSLERVLGYLGVDPEPWLDGFPTTHTPVVLQTDLVHRLHDEIEARGGQPFAEEFVASGLTEFFLYSGWLIATFGTLDGHLDGTVIRSANVWPGRSSSADFARVLSEAASTRASFLSAHRTALFRVGPAGARALAAFWVERGLFPDERRALAFVAAFKLNYLRTMAVRKARSQLAARRAPVAAAGTGAGDA